MDTIKLPLILHEKQNVIHQNKARFKISKVGGQFGKTELAIFDLVQSGNEKHKAVYWYIAPTYGMAKQIAWRRLKQMIPPNLLARKPSEVELYAELWNGTMMVLKGADYEDTLRGVPLDGAIFDEAAFMKREVWEDIIRPRLMIKKGFAHFYSTPNGRNWFTELFYEAKRKMDMNDPEWAAFHYSSWDNPYIDRAELAKAKSQLPDYRYEQEIMANEFSQEGLRLPEFDWSRNVGEYQGNNFLTVYRGLDWGIHHPTVCIWAKLDLETKMIYIFQEYVKTGDTILENCRRIKEMSGTNIEWSVIDPSCAKRNSQTQRRDMDEFSRNGIHCFPGDNSQRGWDIFKMLLKLGRLKISPKCPKLIYEIQHAIWEKDEGDDCLDAAKYMLIRINDYVYGMNIANEPQQIASNVPDFKNSQLSIDTVKLLAREHTPTNMNWVENEIALVND